MLFLVLAAAVRLAAQDDEWNVETGAGLATRRVFRGVVRSGDAAQASFDATDNGFRGSVWINRPFASGEPDETDLTTGYTFKISERIEVEAAATQFLFGNTTAGATRQSTEAGVQASWTARCGLKASLAGFHDSRLQADTAQVAAAYSLALPSYGTYLDFNSFAGCVNGSNLRPDAPGPHVHDGYAYYGAEVQLPYRIPGSRTTLVAGLHFSGAIGQSRSWSPIEAQGGARGWATFAVNFDF